MPNRRRAALAAVLLALVPAGVAGANSTVLVSPGGPVVDNRGTDGLDVSFDGTRVLFSTLDRMTGDDTDDLADVYESVNGAVRLVSTGTAVAPSAYGVMSRDGQRVFFDTTEPLVGADTDARADVYMRVDGGAVQLVTTGTSTVAYRVAGLVDNSEGNLVFVGDTGRFAVATTTEAVAGTSDADAAKADVVAWADQGLGFTPRLASFNANPGADAALEAMSPDRRHLAFRTAERGAPATDPGTATQDVYTRDVLAAAPVHASVAGAGAADVPADTRTCSIAADGSSVVLRSGARAAANDADFSDDIYRRVLSQPGMELLSDSPTGAEQDVTCGMATDDGRTVLFNTNEPLAGLADPDTAADAYASTDGGPPVLRTTAQPVAGNPGQGGTSPPLPRAPNDEISPDGRRFVFHTRERLVAADVNTTADDYLIETGVATPVLLGSGAFEADPVTTPAFSPFGGTLRIASEDVLAPGDDPDDDDSPDVFFLVGGAFQLATPATVRDVRPVGRALDGGSSVVETSASLAVTDADDVDDLYLSTSGVVPTPGPSASPSPSPTASPPASPTAAPAETATPQAPGNQVPVTPPVVTTVTPKPTAAPAAPATASTVEVARANVAFRLSRAAKVTVRVSQQVAGRRAGKRCVKPTKGNRKAKACKRTVTVKTRTAVAKAGANTVAFGTLKPGRYTVTVRPQGGKAVGAALRIKRR